MREDDDDGLVLFAGETVLLIAESSLSGFSTVSVSVKRPLLMTEGKDFENALLLVHIPLYRWTRLRSID